MNSNPNYPSISVHNVKPSMVSVLVTEFSTGFGTVEITIGDMSITLFSNTPEEAQQIAMALSTPTAESSGF